MSISIHAVRSINVYARRVSRLRRSPTTYWPTLGRGSWTGDNRGSVGLGSSRGSGSYGCPEGDHRSG